MSFLDSFKHPGQERMLWIIAFSLGVVACLGNWIYLRRVEAKQILVLRAQKMIAAGTLLDEEQFESVTIAGDLHKMKSLFVTREDLAAFHNRPLTDSLQPGQLLMLRHFTLDGGGVGCCPAGKKALAIEVKNEADGAAFAIRPGHAVDLWGQINGKAVLLKKHAQVKAIGGLYLTPGRDDTPRDNYRSVTILIEEKDIECLVSNLWQADGKTWFVLSGEYDPRVASPAAACLGLPPAATVPTDHKQKAKGKGQKAKL